MSNTSSRSDPEASLDPPPPLPPLPPPLPGADTPLADPRSLRPQLALALRAPAGPELLTQLVRWGAAELSARERVEVARAWRSMIGFCTSGELDNVAALDAVLPRPEDRARSLRPAADELAPVLAISPAAASRLVGLARRLDEDLPAAADALAEGRMDLAQVRLVAAVTKDVPLPDVVTALEALAVQHAPRRTVAQLRRILEAEAARRVPDWTSRRAAAGREERDVRLGPSPLPGCRRVTADLPVVEATAVWMAINAVAAAASAAGDPHSGSRSGYGTTGDGGGENDGSGPGHGTNGHGDGRGRRRGIGVRGDGDGDGDGDEAPRTLPQLRADAFTSLLTGLLVGTGEHAGPVSTDPVAVPPPERLRQLAEVHVVVAADTLLDQSELPADIPGVGALDADAARELAGDARWRRLICDPVSGTLLDRGTTIYAPPARLRRHVVSRDGTCVSPTCSTPGRLTQLDHTIPFGEQTADGRRGTTSHDDLGCACPRHHDGKTHLGWRLDQPSPGRFVWTSPTGLTHAVGGHVLVPGWNDRRTEPGAA